MSRGDLEQLAEIVQKVGRYPIEAFIFVDQGLQFTVHQRFGPVTRPDPEFHVNGADLCRGLREFALQQWGLMAGAVLSSWGIDTTLDFGRIVFGMIEHGRMQKTEQDTLDDFRDVYEFRAAFGAAGYQVGPVAEAKPATGPKK